MDREPAKGETNKAKREMKKAVGKVIEDKKKEPIVSVFICFATVLRLSRKEVLARLPFEVRLLFSGGAIVAV